jgi:predicted dehydrogenase
MQRLDLEGRCKSMKHEKIQIGIVGAGENTRKMHIPQLQTIEGVEVVAIANRSVASAQAAAAPFGITRTTDKWQEIVEDPTIDAICIGTWPYMHAPVTLAALDAGKHVLCEARMACNVAEALAMLAASRLHPELVAQLVPSPFTLAMDDTICDLLQQGAIGELLAVELVDTTGSFQDREAPLMWRQDATLSGLNMLTLGIRYEALMRWVGPAATLAATTTTTVPQRRGADGQVRAVHVPDHIDIVGRLASGAPFNMRFSAVTGLSPRNETRLCGTTGTLLIKTGAPAELFLGQKGEGTFAPVAVPAPPADALPNGWRVEREFIDAIRDIAPVKRTTFADGLRYMEFTEAVHRSAQSKCFVDLCHSQT